MSTNFHTPILTGNAGNAARMNDPLGQLDAAITALGDLGTGGITIVSGNIASLTNGTAAAGQKVITLDDTTGFLVGGRIAYVRNDGASSVEYNVIATIDSGTQITATTNIGTGGIADNAYISLISQSEYQAAQAPNHGNGYEPTLQRAIGNAEYGVYNVRNYGALGDGSTDDTAAIQAAIAALRASTANKEKQAVLRFAPGSIYKVTGSLNMCDLARVIIEGNGARIKSYGLAGAVLFDLVGSEFFIFDHLTLDSDATNPPSAHISLGRSTDTHGVNSGGHTIRSCRFYGSWTAAAIYDCESETLTIDNCYIYNQGPTAAKYGVYFGGRNIESVPTAVTRRTVTPTASTLNLLNSSVVCDGSSASSYVPVFLGDQAAVVSIRGVYLYTNNDDAICAQGVIVGLTIDQVSVEGTPVNTLHFTVYSGATDISNIHVTGLSSGQYTGYFILADANTSLRNVRINDCFPNNVGTTRMQFATLTYAHIRNWTFYTTATLTCVNLYESEVWLLSDHTLTVSSTKRNVTEYHFTATDPHIATAGLALKLEGGSLLHKILTTTFAWDLTTPIADDADSSVLFDLAGVVAGDVAYASLGRDATGLFTSVQLTAGQGRVMVLNKSGAAWPNPGASITVRVTALIAE